VKLPKSISNLINSFERLPGIGPKTAQRLTFYLLNFPQEDLQRFASSLEQLKLGTKFCRVCKNIGEEDLCGVCSDFSRDKNVIAVVSSPLDVYALARSGYKGLFHVLHGVIDPLNSVGPDDLFIDHLIRRLRNFDVVADLESFGGADTVNTTAAEEATMAGNDGKLEVILATNTSLEGENTAMYLSRVIGEDEVLAKKVRLTRIARGLPVGGDIEYADDVTLSRALEGRMGF